MPSMEWESWGIFNHPNSIEHREFLIFLPAISIKVDEKTNSIREFDEFSHISAICQYFARLFFITVINYLLRVILWMTWEQEKNLCITSHEIPFFSQWISQVFLRENTQKNHSWNEMEFLSCIVVLKQSIKRDSQHISNIYPNISHSYFSRLCSPFARFYLLFSISLTLLHSSLD